MLEIRIATGGSVPIYRQIVDRVRRAMLIRAIRPGDRLPSVRALAEQLVINPNTVARAYGDLVRDGVLESRQGKGFFVAPKRPVFTKTERLRRVGDALEGFINEALFLGLSADEIRQAVERKLAELHPPESGQSETGR